MPTYEYECSKCGKVFELFQPITEPPRKKLRSTDPKPCKCNAAVSRRISTGGGLIFKGSGFYLTDYRSESYKEKAKAESGTGETKASETKSSDTASSQPDAKPSSSDAPKAAKSESKKPKKKTT